MKFTCNIFTGYLKKKIAKKTDIPKSRLLLTGWRLPPDADDDILRICADLENINNLIVRERKWVNIPARQPNDTEGMFTKVLLITLTEFSVLDLELTACVNYIQEVKNNISDNTITFHVDLLSNKIAQYCLGPIEQVFMHILDINL